MSVSDEMLARYATELLDVPHIDGDTLETTLTTRHSNEQIYDALFRLAWDSDEQALQALDTNLNSGHRHPALYNQGADVSDRYLHDEDADQGVSFYLILSARHALHSLRRIVLLVGNSSYRYIGPHRIRNRHWE